MWFLMFSVATASTILVAGDVVHLRDQPDGEVMARLRINTAVEILAERGAWVKIRMVERPPEAEVIGWMRGDLLTAHRLGVAAAVERSTNATSVDEALSWAQRAVAADGTNEKARNRLDELGGTPQSETSGWIGVCKQGRVLLAGRFDNLEVETLDALERSVVEDAIVTLGGAAWFFEGTYAVSGTPFVRPFRTSSFNDGGSAYVGNIDRDDEIIVLGPCRNDGVVYVTKPHQRTYVEPYDREQVDPESAMEGAKELFGDLPDTIGTFAVRRDHPIAENSWLQYAIQWERHAGYGSVFGDHRFGLHTGVATATVEHAFNPKWIPIGDGYLVVLSYSDHRGKTISEWGAVLMTVSAQGEIDSQTVILGGGGC